MLVYAQTLRVTWDSSGVSTLISMTMGRTAQPHNFFMILLTKKKKRWERKI